MTSFSLHFSLSLSISLANRYCFPFHFLPPLGGGFFFFFSLPFVLPLSFFLLCFFIQWVIGFGCWVRSDSTGRGRPKKNLVGSEAHQRRLAERERRGFWVLDATSRRPYQQLSRIVSPHSAKLRTSDVTVAFAAQPGESGWLHSQINHLEADSGFVWLQQLMWSIGLVRSLSVSLCLSLIVFTTNPLTMDPMTDEFSRIIDPVQLTFSRRKYQ